MCRSWRPDREPVDSHHRRPNGFIRFVFHDFVPDDFDSFHRPSAALILPHGWQGRPTDVFPSGRQGCSDQPLPLKRSAVHGCSIPRIWHNTAVHTCSIAEPSARGKTALGHAPDGLTLSGDSLRCLAFIRFSPAGDAGRLSDIRTHELRPYSTGHSSNRFG
jgi:hypothetical protein